MMPRLKARRILVAVLVGTTLFVNPPGLGADGGRIRLADAPIGPLLMTVFTEPEPARPGFFDISLVLNEPGSFDLVTGLEIDIRGLGPEGHVLAVEATREQADDPSRFYSAKFELPALGNWRIEVNVTGPGWEDSTTFEVESVEIGAFQNPFVVLTLALLPLAAATLWIRGSKSEPGEG